MCQSKGRRTCWLCLARAESCTALLAPLLWLPSSAEPQTVLAQTRAANRLCMGVIWGLFAPIPSASWLVLGILRGEGAAERIPSGSHILGWELGWEDV